MEYEASVVKRGCDLGTSHCYRVASFQTGSDVAGDFKCVSNKKTCEGEKAPESYASSPEGYATPTAALYCGLAATGEISC